MAMTRPVSHLVALIVTGLGLAGCGLTPPWSGSSEPGPTGPRFTVGPTALHFTASAGGLVPPPAQHVVFFNDGTGFDLLLRSSSPIFSIDENPATPVPGQGHGLDIRVDPPSQHAVGTYTGKLELVPCTRYCVDLLADPLPLLVEVTYTITP